MTLKIEAGFGIRLDCTNVFPGREPVYVLKTSLLRVWSNTFFRRLLSASLCQVCFEQIFGELVLRSRNAPFAPENDTLCRTCTGMSLLV